MQQEITRLLVAMRDGDRNAVDGLLPLLYTELHAMAHRQLSRNRFNETLNTTALVHEAYLKLVDASIAGFQDRHHFFAVSAKAMRQIVIDYARRRHAGKRGGGAHHTVLEALDGVGGVQVEEQAEALLMLDEALSRLAELDARLAQVVEMRFFGGLSVEETAAALGVSDVTVKRDTRAARAFLGRELGLGEAG